MEAFVTEATKKWIDGAKSHKDCPMTQQDHLLCKREEIIDLWHYHQSEKGLAKGLFTDDQLMTFSLHRFIQLWEMTPWEQAVQGDKEEIAILRLWQMNQQKLELRNATFNVNAPTQGTNLQRA